MALPCNFHRNPRCIFSNSLFLTKSIFLPIQIKVQTPKKALEFCFWIFWENNRRALLSLSQTHNREDGDRRGSLWEKRVDHLALSLSIFFFVIFIVLIFFSSCPSHAIIPLFDKSSSSSTPPLLLYLL
jgi:hypothetical protein